MGIKQRLAEKAYYGIAYNIDPVFNRIESMTDKHPALVLPINVILVGAFPAWCLAGFILSNMAFGK